MEHKRNPKIRNAELCNCLEEFDSLYYKSKAGYNFRKLMPIITSPENILLAYRNIKNNKGNRSPGIDRVPFEYFSNMDEGKFVKLIQSKFTNYKSKPVKRVEIPKENGDTRPLGIPCMIDKFIQQCIYQVLEPICEARFYENSYGFRPNRSCEHAIAMFHTTAQFTSKLTYVVDVDIKGFFDNVNHKKLSKQLWALGIRDKQLLCIIWKMLKAPIQLPNGRLTYPDRGTPQGGILSPLLANIALNELDHWVESQWEDIPVYYMPSKRTSKLAGQPYDKGDKSKWRALKNSRLKEMHIIRYADDFKIFCRTRDEAVRTLIAVQKWLKERLFLDISPEKSGITNLKKKSCQFLGFDIALVKKGKKYVISSHICKKARKKIHDELVDEIKRIQKPKSYKSLCQNRHKVACTYNLKVTGIQNYYNIATEVYQGLAKINWDILKVMHNQLDKDMIAKLHGLPVGMKIPKNKLKKINKFTSEGRELIHKSIDWETSTLEALVNQPLYGRSVRYADNRIGKYAAQHGKCSVTGNLLKIGELHCHHIKPYSNGGKDSFDNLVIIHVDVHQLIHAKRSDTIQEYLMKLQLNKKQLKKVNKYRVLAGREEIDINRVNLSVSNVA